MIEDAKLKFALALPRSAKMTVTKETMETSSLVGDKTINALLK